MRPTIDDSPSGYAKVEKAIASLRDVVAPLDGHDPLRLGADRTPERLLLRLAEVLLGDQQAFNRQILDVLQSVAEQLRDARDPFDDVSQLKMERKADREELLLQRSRLDLLLAETRRRLPEPLDNGQLKSFADQLEQRFDVLYADFEVAFRGSRQEIMSKQAEHLSAVQHLAETDNAPVLDIGSGRGEWLEVLRDAGIGAYGVDISEKFVQMGEERGLDVRLGDALEHIRGLPEDSLGAITAFHIAEHLEFPTLVELLDAAHVALRPQGLLLIETPNPTNLNVGASSFYLDPTHRAPLHPLLLQFVIESRGFIDAEIRFLHPDPLYGRLIDEGALSGSKPILEQIDKALFGPQDYAAAAWKAPGRPEQVSL